MNPKYKLLMNFFVIILHDVNTLNTNLEKQTNQNSMHVYKWVNGLKVYFLLFKKC